MLGSFRWEPDGWMVLRKKERKKRGTLGGSGLPFFFVSILSYDEISRSDGSQFPNTTHTHVLFPFGSEGRRCAEDELRIEGWTTERPRRHTTIGSIRRGGMGKEDGDSSEGNVGFHGNGSFVSNVRKNTNVWRRSMDGRDGSKRSSSSSITS